jgi:aspartyl-tRNA(Asn)/glutamyl-tRNA(Gln) amidotransferase subunit A
VVREPFGVAPGPAVAAVFDRTVALIRSAAGIELTEVAALAGPPPRDVFEAMWVTGRGLGFAELIRCHGDVMDPGQLQTLDEREILRQANAAFQRVLARI